MSFGRTARSLATVALLGVTCPHQAHAQRSAVPLIFDISSIHVNHTATDGRHHIYNDPAESHFRCVNVSVRALVQYAYDLPETQVLGGPAWLGSTMFDVDAKSDSAADAQLHTLTTYEARHVKATMLQALLAERFHLTVHRETRQLPVFELMVAKSGPRFQPSDVSGTTIEGGSTQMHVAGSDDTVNLLAAELGRELGRVVLNQTRLKGRYDLHLRWTPAAAVSTAPDAAPDIFTALQEQFGLKLQASTGPVPVLVIDSADSPTDN